jgi:flavin reductase (DIM6/NTAB) family NADH-FMN oxidoreductase RutF
MGTRAEQPASTLAGAVPLRTLGFRQALTQVPTPVTVLTCRDELGFHGTTVGSFATVSYEPELISLGLLLTSRMTARLTIDAPFAVSVLADGQEEIAMRCATKLPGKLDGVVMDDSGGAPTIAGAAAWFRCTVSALLPGGDHQIVLGAVEACGADTDRAPLVYHRRRMGLSTATASSW